MQGMPRSCSGAKGPVLGARLLAVLTAMFWEVHPLAQLHSAEAGYGGLSCPQHAVIPAKGSIQGGLMPLRAETRSPSPQPSTPIVHGNPSS